MLVSSLQITLFLVVEVSVGDGVMEENMIEEGKAFMSSGEPL